MRLSYAAGRRSGVNLDTLWGDRARFLDEVSHSPNEVLESRTVSEAPRGRRACMDKSVLFSPFVTQCTGA